MKYGFSPAVKTESKHTQKITATVITFRTAFVEEVPHENDLESSFKYNTSLLHVQEVVC